MSQRFRLNVLTLVSIALLAVGWTQTASAGLIGTQHVVDVQNRAIVLSELDSLLAQESVAEQLQAFGVKQSDLAQRMQGMTTAELVALQDQIDERIAGGSVVGIVGAVFVVLIVLELVGVTDIFKAF